MGDPVTNHVRPVADILEQARQACMTAGMHARTFCGTNRNDLIAECATILNESRGEPAAIVAYSGADYDNHPRRTAQVAVFLLAARTRVTDPSPDLTAKAFALASLLDDHVTQEVVGGYPVTDRWKLVSEQAADLREAKAATAIVLEFDVEDY